jgi:fucose permease
VPAFLLACITYLGAALPVSTLGLLWPPLRLSIHEPVGALGILLVVSTAASVLSSYLTGRVLSRAPDRSGAVGLLVPGGTALLAAAFTADAVAPTLWVVILGSSCFGAGFGMMDSALNVYAARHFGPRNVNWLHASFGLGATIGPLLVTVLLSSGLSWRWTFGSIALSLILVTCVLAVARRCWLASLAITEGSRQPSLSASSDSETLKATQEEPEKKRAGTPTVRQRTAVLGGLTFTAIEIGIESAAGIWGYVFLTAGRGLSGVAAGVAVSAYWAMMFVGRTIFGQVAQRVGAVRVLTLAVVSVPLGAALMTIPGPGFVAIAGMMTLGLAGAPIFPLITITTPDRVLNSAKAMRAVSLQTAASAVGGSALPAGIGLLIADVSAQALSPALLVLALAMCGVYWFSLHESQHGPHI